MIEDDDDLDQDALAAEWGAALDGDDGDGDGDDAGLDEDVAAQWAAMIDDGDVGGGSETSSGGGERILDQDEIDSLLGFDLDEQALTDTSGIRAIINSAMVSYERLPMLEIIFDRLVRLLTTSLRNFTSDNVEVSLDNISTMRVGDYLNSIPLPAMISVFKAVEWDNYALLTVDSNLIYSIVDVLLGGRGTPAIRIEGRPYTTIETNLMSRLVEVILEDSEKAFQPLSPVRFELERLETNPRFAAIARQANAAILIKLRIDMEDRGGRVEVLMPYGTLEPIRELLLQGFMGEKFGHDNIWESHLATEIYQTAIPIEAVLDQLTLPLKQVMDLRVGETITLNCGPDDPVSLRCGDIPLTQGNIGRMGDNIAVRVSRGIDRPETAGQDDQADQDTMAEAV
ncbi:MAG: flagellar motor switch protein FliM [Methyloligellaceae bacterium]